MKGGLVLDNSKIKDEAVFEKASILAIDCTIGLLLLLREQSDENNEQILGSIQSGICCCNLLLHYLSFTEERKKAFQRYIAIVSRGRKLKDYQTIIEKIREAKENLQNLHNQGYIDKSEIEGAIETLKLIVPSFWANSIDAIMKEGALVWDEIANQL